MHKRSLRALIVLFSISWALEMYRFYYISTCDGDGLSQDDPFFSIVHLGELCRWIFLFNTMLSEGLWLRSRYLQAWIVGSVIVGLYMPIVAAASCGDMAKVSFGLCCGFRGLIALIV
jgi:hypothetical protein